MLSVGSYARRVIWSYARGTRGGPRRSIGFRLPQTAREAVSASLHNSLEIQFLRVASVLAQCRLSGRLPIRNVLSFNAN